MPSQLTLKAARVNAGYTQKQVANALSVDPITIGRWEANPGNMDAKQLKTLCNMYNVSIDDIFLPIIQQ